MGAGGSGTIAVSGLSISGAHTGRWDREGEVVQVTKLSMLEMGENRGFHMSLVPVVTQWRTQGASMLRNGPYGCYNVSQSSNLGRGQIECDVRIRGPPIFLFGAVTWGEDMRLNTPVGPRYLLKKESSGAAVIKSHWSTTKRLSGFIDFSSCGRFSFNERHELGDVAN